MFRIFLIVLLTCSIHANERPSTRDECPNFHLVNVVWGRDFTHTFVTVSLPLQLGSGNLRAFSPGTARYKLFTTHTDWQYMQKFPSIKKLQEIMPIDVIDVMRVCLEMNPSHIESNKYIKMTHCHNYALKQASKDNVALIFLSPDCLISNQTMKTIINKAIEGKRALLVMALRTKKEEMVPLIASVLKNDSQVNDGVSSRDLVGLSLPHLHDATQSLIFNGKEINAMPCNIYWELDSNHQNLLGFGFHLHPIFVWPETSEMAFGTIDDEFIAQSCPSKDKWEVIQDSDEMAIFEISSKEGVSMGMEMMACTPEAIAMWGRRAARAHHWLFLEKPIYIHSTDRQLGWMSIEATAKAFIAQILMNDSHIEK